MLQFYFNIKGFKIEEEALPPSLLPKGFKVNQIIKINKVFSLC